jgi:hypothetical protein
MALEIVRKIIGGKWTTVAEEEPSGGTPFNGGTITENLVIDTASGPQLFVEGAVSGDYDALFAFDVPSGAMFRGFTDGTGLWRIQEEGSAFAFEQPVGALAGDILTVADYGVIITEANASGGQELLHVSREAGGKIGFFNATPVARQTNVADPTGGSVIDVECRAALASLLTKLEAYGLLASS